MQREVKVEKLVKLFMAMNWILANFNVLKDFRTSFLPCFVNPLFDLSLFKILKKDVVILVPKLDKFLINGTSQGSG